LDLKRSEVSVSGGDYGSILNALTTVRLRGSENDAITIDSIIGDRNNNTG